MSFTLNLSLPCPLALQGISVGVVRAMPLEARIWLQRVRVIVGEIDCCVRGEVVEERTVGDVAPVMSIHKCGEGTLSGEQ